MIDEHYTGECLKDLFRNTHCIESLLEQFFHLGTRLREISVNAAIASGHVESQSKIFSEIAKQIGSTSTLIAQLAERSKTITSQVSTRVLACIVDSGQREHFSFALRSIRESYNHTTVRHVCLELSKKISDQLHEAQLALSHLKPEQDGLRQVNNRLSSIVVALRVLANTAAHGEGTFFLSIAESIEETSDVATKICGSLQETVALINAALSERCACMRGELNAA